MAAGVALKIGEELVGGAVVYINGEVVLGLVGVGEGLKAEAAEVFEGFLMVEAVFQGLAVAVALSEFVIGADVEDVAVVRFDVMPQVFEEELGEFGVFEVEEGTAGGDKGGFTEEGGFCYQHGGGEDFALGVLNGEEVRGPAV